MTRMLPTRLFTSTAVDGEVDVFNRLINDPATIDWTAIHSLHLPEHSTQREGEEFCNLCTRERGSGY